MKRTSVPKALQERLGGEGTDALVDVLNRQREQMTDAIIRAIVRAIVRELEPRFGAIGVRLTAIDERFTVLDERFAGIESQLSRLMVLQAVTLLAVIGATVRMLLA